MTGKGSGFAAALGIITWLLMLPLALLMMGVAYISGAAVNGADKALERSGAPPDTATRTLLGIVKAVAIVCALVILAKLLFTPLHFSN